MKRVLFSNEQISYLPCHVQTSGSLIPYAKQSLNEEDIAAACNALRGSQITRGPIVREFEQALQSEFGVRHAVIFNSGSSALDAAYFALGLKKQTVVTTPISYIATINAPLKCQSPIQFIDVDPTTAQVDLNSVVDALNNNPDAIFVPMHYGGEPFDLEALWKRATRTSCIEDAAHSIGSQYPCGAFVGSCLYSDLTVFSFHPAKNITSAEGGVVTTNSAMLYERLLIYRNNGIARRSMWDYDVVASCGNYHMSDVHAALGLSQLKRLKTFKQKRQQLAKLYVEQLQHVPGIEVRLCEWDSICPHLMVVLLDEQQLAISKLQLQRHLLERGIQTQVHYIPLYLHSALKEYDFHPLPGAQHFYARAISLPLYFDLEMQQVEMICEEISKAVRKSTLLKGA